MSTTTMSNLQEITQVNPFKIEFIVRGIRKTSNTNELETLGMITRDISSYIESISTEIRDQYILANNNPDEPESDTLFEDVTVEIHFRERKDTTDHNYHIMRRKKKESSSI